MLHHWNNIPNIIEYSHFLIHIEHCPCIGIFFLLQWSRNKLKIHSEVLQNVFRQGREKHHLRQPYIQNIHQLCHIWESPYTHPATYLRYCPHKFSESSVRQCARLKPCSSLRGISKRRPHALSYTSWICHFLFSGGTCRYWRQDTKSSSHVRPHGTKNHCPQT